MKGLRSLFSRRACAGALLLLTTVAVAGCSSSSISTPPPDAPGNFVALTEPIIMLGDTQEHEATGFPLQDNDNAIDAYVEVAQRPAEQPLFGRRVLEWVLENHAGEPVVHLGDVMDVSCASEGERLAKIMAAAKQEGAILPGNHDGLMFGIFNYDIANLGRDRDSDRWDRACRRAAYLDGDPDAPPKGKGGAYTKRDFIVSYLQGIVAKVPAGAGPSLPPADDRDWRLSWRSPRPESFVEAVEVLVTPAQRYAGSFLAQKLRLPRAPGSPRGVTILAVDTNQIDRIVGALDAFRGISPGNIGHIQPSQIEVLERWARAARTAGDLVLFAGHHDWASLGPETKRRLAAVMRGLDHPLVYFSAHTHSGFWAHHHVAGRNLLELNVSSLSDWPIAYRRMEVQFDAQANRIKIVGSLMPMSGTPGRGDAESTGRSARDDLDLLHMWERVTCARAGVPLTVIRQRDMSLVKAQRDGRGSLFEWLYSWIGGDECETCVSTLYTHAHAYLDLMMTAIKNTSIDMGREVPELAAVRLPAMCPTGIGLSGCVEFLKEQKPANLQENIALFRVKANLIDRANTILDDEGSPRAKAYMTCRAVQAAKDDYDMTPESSMSWRTEAVRRAGDFFRLEATVGMEEGGTTAPLVVAPSRPLKEPSMRPSRGRAGRP